MSADYDIAIIGGGPAGTAAALTLRKRKDIRVAVIESGAYGEAKIGESLSPGVRSLLQYLGVWDRFEREQTLRLFASEAAWGDEALGSMDFILTLHGEGWSLDRRRFELMLAEEAERAGARLLTGTKAHRCTFDGDRWRIETSAQPITARYLIDAAGRVSRFSAEQGAVRQRNDDLTAVTARVAHAPDAPHTTRVEAIEEGWWYLAPLPSGEAIACLFSDARLIHGSGLAGPDGWRRGFGATRHLAPLIDPGADLLSEVTAQPALSSILRGFDMGLPMVAAGDAIASRDPLSSSGIPNAIGGGVQAARVAADHLFGEGRLKEAYLESVALDHDAYLRTHWKTYQTEKRWPDSPFWRFRSACVERGPDTKVRAKPGASRSIFAPRPVAAWIARAADRVQPQAELATAAHAEYPDLPAERLLLAVEDVTEVVISPS